MYESELTLIKELRASLHACPEISGSERRTKAALIGFLRIHTTLELHECGGGFYAAKRSGSAEPAIVLRADYDALALPGGGAAHLCGHDGHAAALCGAALMLEHMKASRDVLLLFQPAEETGAGAVGCCEIFGRESVGEIYGLHNLPGFPLGEVYVRAGTFACASLGLTLSLHGKATHAAYPENGISPASALGELLCRLPELSAREKYSGMVLCTVIGAQMGEKAFGAAAAAAELWLTLRGEHDSDLEALRASIIGCAGELAAGSRLGFEYSEQDIFPSTENAPECAAKVMTCCGGHELPEPMRWSEDFGHYLKHCRGAFFGIGAGEDQAPLHTDGYEYPDALLGPAINAFMRIVSGDGKINKKYTNK